jgi:hypothetical protein
LKRIVFSADMPAAKGVTEDELVADFKKWRSAKRK